MILKKGSKGKEVKEWQEFLNENLAHDSAYSNIDTDGNFGRMTEGKTKRFQRLNWLQDDGIVGSNTANKAKTLGYKPMEKETITRPINEIIVHITANGNGLVGEALRKNIEAGHIARGFDEIGYHWLVDKMGNVIKGRDENKIGAHCKAQGKNHNTIGIAYDARGNDNDPNGKYGKYFQSDAQREVFERLIQEKMQEFNVTKVTGHNKYDAGKACPCFDSESKEFKQAIGL